MPEPTSTAAFLSAIMPAVVTAGQGITNAMGVKRQYKYNVKAMHEQNKLNRENQEWALEQNRKLLAEQLAYDSPEAQMARYKAAGLNPHLIYGQGSSGTQGSPISIGAPDSRMAPVDASIPNYAGTFLSAQQQVAQLGLTDARTEQTMMKTQADAMQVEIAKTNPMLNPSVASWVASSMEETAKLKAMEARFLMHRNKGETISDTRMANKIEMEIELMSQRLGLNTADIAIRNKILESKEYENAVKELQANWLKNGDFTPEHIRQGLMLLLSKMIGR